MDIKNIMIIMDEYINLGSVSQLPLSSYKWKYNPEYCGYYEYFVYYG